MVRRSCCIHNVNCYIVKDYKWGVFYYLICYDMFFTWTFLTEYVPAASQVGITPLDLLKEWGALFVAVVAVVYSIVSSKQNQNFLEKQQKRNEKLVKYQVALACCNSQMQTLVPAIANTPTKEIWKAFEDSCTASDKLISMMKQDFPE